MFHKKNDSNKEIIIFWSLGKKVLQTLISSELNVSSLNPGVYIKIEDNVTLLWKLIESAFSKQIQSSKFNWTDFLLKLESFLISEELLKFIPLQKKILITATDIFAISVIKAIWKTALKVFLR
jgi:hypothetical protein